MCICILTQAHPRVYTHNKETFQCVTVIHSTGILTKAKLMQRWAPKVFLVTLRLVQFDVRPRPQLRKPNTAMQVLCLQGQCDWGSGCLAFPAKLASPQPDIDLVSKIVWGYESISSLKREKHLVNLHLPSQTKVASILWHP